MENTINQTIAPIPNTEGSTPRGPDFDPNQDLVVAQAFIDASLDPEVGASQKGKDFWAKVFAEYTANKLDAWPERDATKVHARWNTINTIVSRYASCVASIYRLNQSGARITDTVTMHSNFTSAEWQQINQLFQKKHRIPDTSPLNPTLSTTLKVIDATLKQTSNIKMGLLYLYKIYGKHHSTSLMPSLQIFEHVLNLLDQESDLLQVKPTTMISETDYVAYIWLPLFRKLFHAGTNIQIKTGETTFPFSTACKQQLYPGASNVTGFKIDLRFVVHQGGLEFDVCSVEACCNSANDDKIIADEGKLNREVKDDLDGMMSLVHYESRPCTAWGMQIMGPSCLIFSLHLSDQGLYIALPRFDIMLPRSTAELIKFEKTMVDLLTFRREVLKSVNFVMEHFISNKQLKSLNRLKAQMTSATQDSSPQRDTWYTPPKGTASRQPVRLVSAVPQSLNAKLLSIACEESMAILQKKATGVNLVADEFGWAFDGKVWRNLNLGISMPHNPYENDV